MKKKYYGSDDIISVYKFMKMCGLDCEPKSNIAISHEIMLRKLNLRHEKFPNKVLIPEAVSTKEIYKDDVKMGRTILVKDDTKNVRAYRLPNIFIDTMSKEEKEAIRNKLIEEREQEEQSNNKEMKKGYMKYLYRKSLKEEKKKLEELKEEILEEFKYENYEITESVCRLKKLENKRRRY